MVEHVRAHVFKRGNYLKAKDLQMPNGERMDTAILKMEKIGRENRRLYYKKYLECGKPDESCLTKLPKEKSK